MEITEELKKSILNEYLKSPEGRLEMFQRFTEPLLAQAARQRADFERFRKGVEKGLQGDDLFRWMGANDDSSEKTEILPNKDKTPK